MHFFFNFINLLPLNSQLSFIFILNHLLSLIKFSCVSVNELAHSLKDLREHKVVTEYVGELLGQLCQSFNATEKEEIFRLKNVQHIRSRFEGICRPGIEPFGLLDHLHPTPAVGGRPRESALKFLKKVEPLNRGWFAGPIGWTDGESGDFAIGIRTALIKDKHLTVFGGAGIVAGSDPEAEWVETEMKMKNFLDLIEFLG